VGKITNLILEDKNYKTSFRSTTYVLVCDFIGLDWITIRKIDFNGNIFSIFSSFNPYWVHYPWFDFFL